MSEGTGWSDEGAADAPGFCRCARSIENFCKIKMVVARASGMDLASILKRSTFLTLGVRPVGRGPCGPRGTGGTRGGPGRGDTVGPGTGGHAVPFRGGVGGGTFLRGWAHLCKIQPNKDRWYLAMGGPPSVPFFGGCHGVPPHGKVRSVRGHLFASSSTPRASQKLSRPPFESY